MKTRGRKQKKNQERDELSNSYYNRSSLAHVRIHTENKLV